MAVNRRLAVGVEADEVERLLGLVEGLGVVRVLGVQADLGVVELVRRPPCRLHLNYQP